MPNNDMSFVTQDDHGFNPPTNDLRIHGRPFGLEKAYDYEAGGHHPVHLGDLLHQRYKVLHKLGSGGYANVWLCRDTSSTDPRYVALKIIMAEGSTPNCPELRIYKLIELGLGQESAAEHFCLPLDRFDIDGPNGIHYVFVYPVLGPRVSRVFNVIKLEDPGIPLRELCFQTTLAMAVLHKYGICHGDFRPANILLRLSGLDGLNEEELFAIFGPPQTAQVLKHSGEAHDMPTAPQYVVYPIDWDDVASSAAGSNLIQNKACITDFGECFEISTPTLDLGIPQVYLSPEYCLERKKLPEPWWSETWTARKRYFQDDTDSNGLVVAADNTKENGRTGYGDGDIADIPRVVIDQSYPRSLQAAIAEGLFYEYKNSIEGVERSIPQKEIAIFADLLSKLLRYSPSERISPSEALEHEWFQLEKSDG
ncbi:putative Protein kinase [Scedosporium apiospermum]|uniref:EKC/KEOPS complex subunit BUD32 n=1 Tax=Pseudallescheria apiosperma TaxID=563466 RepID=A0A084FYH8_PSEDA|nr:putative Protein kinase [Scedosporium apiospermum]KEZ40140.1 putative Protein kinase [Scedosporium apiospermum]